MSFHVGHLPKLYIEFGEVGFVYGNRKVETPIHDNIRELVTWECKYME